jgi:hypothetical protein
MNCTLDSIKNNRLVVSSLAVIGLTAVGALAHRLGLLTLCSKALSVACGHVAAVVQRHRFASTVLVLVTVGTVCLMALAAVVRSRKCEASSPSQPQEVPAKPTQSNNSNPAIMEIY